MEKSIRNDLPLFSPYLLSIIIHALFAVIMLSITYINYLYAKKKSLLEASREVQIESIVISKDTGFQRTESEQDAVAAHDRRGAGPYGLNDSAGRELIEAARSGISVTPDNFLEYAKIRSLRKGLNVKPKEDIFEKYPFLTGSSKFQSGIGRKIKTDFGECYDDACRMIELDRSSREEPERFTAAVLDYLSGKRPVRTWRTLWMVRKPAEEDDKIKLVHLIRRLHFYGIEGENAGYEYMRRSIASMLDLIPDELKFPRNPRG
ncbi:MAG: hypothetical protein KA369_10710 [Spirochaetes bacterium]|nr:hypothetical protein [Spirochaetota bacterium]